MSSLNSCSFIGNLGRDPEVKQTQGGEKVAHLSIACSEKWKGRDGERKERTTWVPVVIWGPLVEIVERYTRKGSRIYVSGKFSVRKWQDRDGQDRYTTEIVLTGYDAKLILLDGAGGGQHGDGRGERRRGYDDRDDRGGWGKGGSNDDFADDLNDDIPF